ncbi:PilZ domain-containing protein [Limisalsivibrio acetivorans]|uniref:PilZ domain-containing protein n=1 Tax=Limisalsivibrio acetivorans TaxID=1304888 RepID=UPI0003B75090|nr:PilZ domain-containing protein [Limisalsivibrio acetivorans]
MRERRRYHRFEDLPVKVELKSNDGSGLFEAEIIDVGIGGMKIRTDENITIYEKYMMLIKYPEDESLSEFEVEGKAWRIEPDTEINNDISRYVAIEFTGFDEKYRKMFTRFIANYLVKSNTEEEVY